MRCTVTKSIIEYSTFLIPISSWLHEIGITLKRRKRVAVKTREKSLQAQVDGQVGRPPTSLQAYEWIGIVQLQFNSYIVLCMGVKKDLYAPNKSSL